MSHALVLSGGGALGAYEAGAADVLVRHYAQTAEPIAIVSGTSVGALNAAALAQAGNGELMLNIWHQIRERSVFKRGRWGPISTGWRALRRKPLYDTSPLRSLLERNLHVFAIQDSRIQLFVHAADLVSRRLVVWANDSPDLMTGIFASAALPGLFPPVTLHNGTYRMVLVDGGVLANTPISSALRAGASRVTVVYMDHERLFQPTRVEEMSSPSTPGGHKAFDRSWEGDAFKSLSRTLEIMMCGHFQRDLRQVRLVNDMVDLMDQDISDPDALRDIRINVVQPRSQLEGSTLDFDPAVIRRNIRRGARDARHFLSNL